jgi:hypothetical protein
LYYLAIVPTIFKVEPSKVTERKLERIFKVGTYLNYSKLMMLISYWPFFWIPQDPNLDSLETYKN